MNLDIDGKVALVCGSSQGLGRAIATALADEGCRVVMNGRDTARLEAAVAAVRRQCGADVRGFAADVSIAEQATALVERVRDELESLSILVCNAGGPAAAPFAATPPEAWAAALELNLLSTIHLCRAAVPVMERRRWGRIICLASVAARQPLPGLILSTTARAGVLGFAKSLADEVAASGITVNVVCPGYMRTDRVDDLIRQRAASTGEPPQHVQDTMVRNIPAGRMGDPSELASAVVFLASDGARYITGTSLPVDGGFTRSIL